MRCLSPRTVGFLSDGKTISWSPKHYSKEYATFQLPCSKCIECRLEYARQWAVRCVHEAKMHEDNSFITLTYSDENLKSPKLQYIDFQLFAKRLRKKIHKEAKKQGYDLETKKISIFVTGEYGDKTKRPHWHAIIFNWRPTDAIHHYSNERGDKIYTSRTLTELWTHGHAELGSVTFESAGYVARYAAKKLIHGEDQNHDFHPISKKSSKNAIGKKFLETFYKDIFNYGEVILDNGTKTSIPRYYEKWLQKNHPDEWVQYITKLKAQRIQSAEKKSLQIQENENNINNERLKQNPRKGFQISRTAVRTKIIKDKFAKLQKHLKGDI